MPTVYAEMERVKWLLAEGKIQPGSKCKLVLPEIDAKERIRNEAKCKRIVMATDEQNFSEFHALSEAYMLAVGQNPTLRVLAIIEAMRQFDVRGWMEAQETLGDA